MGRRIRSRLAPLVVGLTTFTHFVPLLDCADKGTKAKKPTPFEERLESRVADFDTRERPLVKAVLDLMYEYQLPLGLEYVDREAVQRPLKLKLNNKPVREILQMIVGQLPQYEISFSQGVVETYSPKARTDPTNPLNVFIDNFEVSDQSPRVASTELYGTVAVKLHQPGGLIGDVLDSGHPRNVTLHLQRKRVYQLLNAIVAQNGESLWASTVPPEKLSKLDGSPWQVYGLGPGWEEIILGELQRLFPRQK